MKKVLVVDDTKNIRTLLTTCLEIEGYQVETSKDGNQALELLKTSAFDLIFLDIKLPELSGTEVLRQIRERGLHTPVIIMTAFATVKNAVECTKLGAVSYLQKPFTAEKIRSTLLGISSNHEDGIQTFESYLNSGRTLVNEGKFAEAFRFLKQALAINPDCGEIYSLIARVHEGQGNIPEASRFYKIARQFED
jgi:Response regulator containing CheY-like receiver, AAA-type ATPase, and DNA-binding domains